MSSKVQRVIDRGILEEDPDGVLWLSARAKKTIAIIEGDEALMAAIKEKAIDEEDAQIGLLAITFIKCCPDATSKEFDDGVHALRRWRQGAEESRLNEWSMRLRLGETRI